MRAVYFTRHGGPEVLEYGTMADPVRGPQEVLVDVKACALNHLDIWVRTGVSKCQPMPHIPGSDVSGAVLEAPSGSVLKKGQRVVVSPGRIPAKDMATFEGRDSFSPDFNILGLQTQGGYAERVSAPEPLVIPVSDRYSFEEWASLPLASLTAYHMLITRAGLKKGETVLVHAGGSGIGGHALQIARHLGARVLTTVGDEAKASRARQLGADEVIFYRTEDFAEKVASLTGGRGVDVVFEHIGPDVWQKSLSSLVRGGRLVTCGATSGPKAEIDIRYLYAKQLSIIGSYMGSLSELRAVLELAEKGILTPVVDKVFPLGEAAEAHRYMESRKNFGKIVLRV